MKRITLIFLISLLYCGCFAFCEGDWIYYNQEYNIKVESFSQLKGSTCINNKYKIDVAYDSERPVTMIFDYIKEGDIIHIPANSDTIFVIRNQDDTKWFVKHGMTESTREYGVNDIRRNDSD